MKKLNARLCALVVLLLMGIILNAGEIMPPADSFVQEASYYPLVCIAPDLQEYCQGFSNLSVRSYIDPATGRVDMYIYQVPSLPRHSSFVDFKQIEFFVDSGRRDIVSIIGHANAAFDALPACWVEQEYRPEHIQRNFTWFTIPISPLMNISVAAGYKLFFSKKLAPSFLWGSKKLSYLCQDDVIKKYSLTPEQVLHGVCGLIVAHFFNAVYVPCIGFRFAPEAIFSEDVAAVMNSFLFKENLAFDFAVSPAECVRAQVACMQRTADLGYRKITIADVGLEKLTMRVEKEKNFWQMLGNRSYTLEVENNLIGLAQLLNLYRRTFEFRSRPYSFWFEALFDDIEQYINCGRQRVADLEGMTESSVSLLSVESDGDAG